MERTHFRSPLHQHSENFFFAVLVNEKTHLKVFKILLKLLGLIEDACIVLGEQNRIQEEVL